VNNGRREQKGAIRIGGAGIIKLNGVVRMPQYRFYNLEKQGRAIIARIELTLDDDATAVACAEQLMAGEEIEIWQDSRLVASLCALTDTTCVASAA
jgi:hypothetical protein